jgi:hypothetical protein
MTGSRTCMAALVQTSQAVRSIAAIILRTACRNRQGKIRNEPNQIFALKDAAEAHGAFESRSRRRDRAHPVGRM